MFRSPKSRWGRRCHWRCVDQKAWMGIYNQEGIKSIMGQSKIRLPAVLLSLINFSALGLCFVTTRSRFILQRPEGSKEFARPNIPRWISPWIARRHSWNRQRLHKEEARIQNQVSLLIDIIYWWSPFDLTTTILLQDCRMAANFCCKHMMTQRCNNGLDHWKPNAIKPALRVDHKHCQLPRRKTSPSDDPFSPWRKSKRLQVLVWFWWCF